MSGNALRAVLAIRKAQDDIRRDPLASFSFASEKHRQACEEFYAGTETHLRGANYSGKTQLGSAGVVAMYQQRDELDGLKVPRIRGQVVGAVLVASYEQQKDSSQRAIRDHLGDWPHVEAYADRGRDIVSTLWIRPQGHRNDDPQTWNRLSFISQANSSPDAIKGQRWTGPVLGDEPPVEAFWREARKNTDFRIIVETPLKRAEWEWLQKDFDGALGQRKNGRIEIVTTLDDNRFLTHEQRRDLEQRYSGDPHFRARMFGEYVNVDGACPFPYQRLEQLLRWAEPGEPHPLDPRVETWRELDPREEYWVILDPSAGIKPMGDSAGGDRCALWVVAVRARAGVARFFGYLPPHRLAEMAVRLGHYYGTALIVPEVNGVGEAMLPVLEDYPNVYRDVALERVERDYAGRVGWYQSEQTKAACVGALIAALDPKAPSLDIPCADAVRSLMEIRQDDRGRLVRRAHQNHEDMICLGMAAYLLQHPSYAAPQLREARELSAAEKFAAAYERSNGVPFRSARRAPRGTVDRWR